MRKKLLDNLVYAALIGHCEELEHSNTYKGNGHHLAQKLTGMVCVSLLDGNLKKIYDCLNIPKNTKQIALETGIPSKHISATLRQSKTNCIGYIFKTKPDGTKSKHKIWSRNY